MRTVTNDVLAEDPVVPEAIAGVGEAFLRCGFFNASHVVADHRHFRVEPDASGRVPLRLLGDERTFAFRTDLPSNADSGSAPRAFLGGLSGPHGVIGVGNVRDSVSRVLGLTPVCVEARRVSTAPLWGPNVVLLRSRARVPLVPLFLP